MYFLLIFCCSSRTDGIFIFHPWHPFVRCCAVRSSKKPYHRETAAAAAVLRSATPHRETPCFFPLFFFCRLLSDGWRSRFEPFVRCWCCPFAEETAPQKNSVCVRSSYPSTSGTTSVRADFSILLRETIVNRNKYC